MSTDRHDPLDADERELARVLRALPAGEPPSTLDARILAMARDAVVSTPVQKDEAQPRRHRAPRFIWGLGVAASCVMAAGLVYRMGGFGAESLDVVGTELREDVAETAAAAEPTLQPAPPMPEAQDEPIRVEIGTAASKPRVALAPPPPPPEQRAPQRARMAAEPSPASASAAPPAPSAVAEPEAEADLARLQELSEPSRRESAERQQVPAMMAPAPASEAFNASSADAAAGPASLESITVYGSRVGDVGIDPIVSADGNAGAQTWIQRIRARIARGDVDGARISLDAFIERHPRKPLPQDLIDFRAGGERSPADAADTDAG
jgi:hypothetical protein